MIRSVDDLSDSEVRWVLSRAREHRSGAAERLVPPPLVGLCFLEASLRTRVGFTAAAARLGGQAVGVAVQRASDIAQPESIRSTLRTLLGYTDVVVARPGVPLVVPTVPADVPTPLINGGDRGPRAEHPSQALIDLFAIETERGAIGGVTLGVVGDLRVRAVTSLLRLVARFRPRAVRLFTTEGLRPGLALPDSLDGVVSWGAFDDPGDIDVLYVAGVPHGVAGEDERATLRVTPALLSRLATDAVVTSPLPLVDEIDADCYEDPRWRAPKHSDDGLFVRMALLELALDASGGFVTARRRGTGPFLAGS